MHVKVIVKQVAVYASEASAVEVDLFLPNPKVRLLDEERIRPGLPT